MVIQNFYMVILYTLCGYSLLCLCVKLLLDRNREKKTEKKKKIIYDFFLFRSKKEPAEASLVMRLAQDDFLFAYICECYIKLSPQYTLYKRQKMSEFMQSLMESKIASLTKEDVQTRCLILRYLFQTGIHSDTINQFVNGCRKQSKLEQTWVKVIGLSEDNVSEEISVKTVCKLG